MHTFSHEAQEIVTLHRHSDVDSHANAQHHTLGPKAGQSAPGDHIHDNKGSKRLYEQNTKNTGAFAAVNTDKTVAVTFTTKFKTAPRVFCQILAASAVNIGFPVVVDPATITTTGFSFVAARAVGTGAIDVEWVAYEAN